MCQSDGTTNQNCTLGSSVWNYQNNFASQDKIKFQDAASAVTLQRHQQPLSQMLQSKMTNNISQEDQRKMQVDSKVGVMSEDSIAMQLLTSPPRDQQLVKRGRTVQSNRNNKGLKENIHFNTHQCVQNIKSSEHIKYDSQQSQEDSSCPPNNQHNPNQNRNQQDQRQQNNNQNNSGNNFYSVNVNMNLNLNLCMPTGNANNGNGGGGEQSNNHMKQQK